MNNNFRHVDTCITCQHCLALSDYDEPTNYYCALEEEFNWRSYMKNTNSDEIKIWCLNHQVEEDSVCDDYLKRK